MSLLVVPLSPNISILIGPTVSAKCESRVVHVTKYFEDRFVESLLKLLTARCGDAFLDENRTYATYHMQHMLYLFGI